MESDSLTSHGALSPQLAGFLSDLLFVGCGFAALLYALWFVLKRKSLVGFGRLSLVVAFGALVTLFAIGATAGVPVSFPLYYLFVLVALFVLLEFLFQMSALGLLVSLVGVGVGAIHYVPQLSAPVVRATGPVVAYWWLLRDLAVTTGAAVLTLGLGTAALLYVFKDRRPTPLVHPNDLRDVSALLARGAVPCFFFGAAAAAMALYNNPRPTFADAWATALLFVLFVASGVWWATAEGRRYKGARGVGVLVLTLLLLVAYAARGFLGAG